MVPGYARGGGVTAALAPRLFTPPGACSPRALLSAATPAPAPGICTTRAEFERQLLRYGSATRRFHVRWYP